MTPLDACRLFLEKATLDGAPQADLCENGVYEAMVSAVASARTGHEVFILGQSAIPHEGDVLERKTMDVHKQQVTDAEREAP